ncbi:MAG: undecaprenyl-diphosphate phosphatase [Firmicutes bacterium]|nr:undecaprenyl-diphosphate phosphatase [Bacillota bacterium]
MNLIEAIILGLVQGLTEFLPVSSSGHLVIFQDFLGMNQPGVTLEVILHFGTLLSVLVIFGRDFLELLRFPKDTAQRRFLLLLLVGMVPTALIAFLLGDYMELLFDSTLAVGVMLLVTGGMLKLLTLLTGGQKDINGMQYRDALWIGLLQGVAIIPGISRSGSTITAAIWRGLAQATAVRYSFMLAAPVIFGATLLEVKDMIAAGIERALLINYLAGGLVAFLAGVVAIKTFISLLKRHKFHYFAYYCWAAGAFTVIYALIKHGFVF